MKHRWCPCGAKVSPVKPWEGDPARDWYCGEEDDVLLRHEARGPLRHFWDLLGQDPTLMFLTAGSMALLALTVAACVR